jgi:hypothetical protein
VVMDLREFVPVDWRATGRRRRAEALAVRRCASESSRSARLDDELDGTDFATPSSVLHRKILVPPSPAPTLPPANRRRTHGEPQTHARRSDSQPGAFSWQSLRVQAPDDHPLNHGDLESTAAIPPTETAIPRQPLPQDFPQRHRLQAAELLAAHEDVHRGSHDGGSLEDVRRFLR